MPHPVFPTALFAFDEQEIDIERRVISGGVSLSGAEDLIATDGGGRVFAEFANGPLMDRETMLIWRAFTAISDEGATPVVVPFCDPLHQPGAPRHRVPHSDGTSFDDDTLYEGGGSFAALSQSAGVRATTLVLDINLPIPLVGGEWLSIDHGVKGVRAYKIRQVIEQTSTTATISIRPPLRESCAAGEQVDFNEPRCLMVQQGRASSRIELGQYGEASIRFVEAP